MEQERGNVSVNTENIFPIIRKWLYSEREIFLRELVSNAADANSKLRRLHQLGEFELPEDEKLAIWVTYDSEKNELVIEDNGIGMTADEIRKYINQIAFSGVMDFVEKYKDKAAEENGIIGHFGLGFYSAFMVADKVRIDTKSYQSEAEAASWESEDGMTYVLGASDRDERGSKITLTLSEEGIELLKESSPLSILEKYCNFMPYPLFFTDVKAEKEKAEREAKEAAEKAKKSAAEKDSTDEKEVATAAEETPAQEEKAAQPINDTEPLWLKKPGDCTDEEYKEFYRKAFQDYREPLFWIHLNLDYPFRLKGILYFPRTDNVYESLEGRIKIYYNQVFVADNIKEIIPEFLFLLKGTLDCPDLPLNVSRSFLQNDAYVSKLSSHIVRKVADKLTALYKNKREDYEKYWPDIGVFVKYGMLREEKFYDRVKDIALFRTVDDKYKVLSDLGDTLLYTPDPKKQVAYINMAQARGLDVLVMDHELDNHFMSFIEFKNQGKKFKRVDAELEGGAGDAERKEKLQKLFREATGREKLEVELKALGEKALPAMIVESEESRRMQEMRQQFERYQSNDSEKSVDDLFPLQQTLVVNEDEPLVGRLVALAEIPGRSEQVNLLACHLYDLARLGHGSLESDDMAQFLRRSSQLLSRLATEDSTTSEA